MRTAGPHNTPPLMDETYLYQKVAETIRREILKGNLNSGDRLPSVRQLCQQWSCTPGTVQRAYSELAHEGLVISQAGRGTRVAGSIPGARAQAQGTLRTVNLVHRSEAFLLEALTAGYDLSEIQAALDLAADRWRAVDQSPPKSDQEVIRFNGSHDMVVSGLAHNYFGGIAVDVSLQVSFTGSLSGLSALAGGSADLCGCHLWDAESDTYNFPFIRKALPGKAVTVVTLAHRLLGLIVAPGNPLHLQSLADLVRPGVRFANRQPGSGTRVWFDLSLDRLGISPRQVQGYRAEHLTHSDIARVVAEGSADVGLGLETAAVAYGLDFIQLTRERYDLVFLSDAIQRPSIQRFLAWLRSVEGKNFIAQYKGYDNLQTGVVQTSP